MDWKTVAAQVSKAAPLVGGLLGGPLGAAGGSLVTKMVSSALGVPDDADSVGAALASDPTAYEKLAEVESNNKVAFQQLAITAQQNEFLHENEQLSIAAKDRDSARNMAIVTKDNFTKVLASLVTLGFFGMLGLLTFAEIPESNKPVLYIMVGSLGTAWATVMAFYFGTTKSSAEHSATLNDQMSKITDFAVSPGSVTTPDTPQPAPTVINNNSPTSVDNNLYKGS